MLNFRDFLNESIIHNPRSRIRGPRRPVWRRRDDMHRPPPDEDHGDNEGCKFDPGEVSKWIKNGGWKEFGKNFMDHILKGEHEINTKFLYDIDTNEKDFNPILVRYGMNFNPRIYNKYHLKKGDPHFEQLHEELKDELLQSTIWHNVKIINPAACMGYPEEKAWGDWRLDGELPYCIGRVAYEIRGKELLYLAKRDLEEAGIDESTAKTIVRKVVNDKLNKHQTGLAFPKYYGTIYGAPEDEIPYDLENIQIGGIEFATYVSYYAGTFNNGLEISFGPNGCVASVGLQIPVFVPWTDAYSKWYTKKINDEYSKQWGGDNEYSRWPRYRNRKLPDE